MQANGNYLLLLLLSFNDLETAAGRLLPYERELNFNITNSDDDGGSPPQPHRCVHINTRASNNTRMNECVLPHCTQRTGQHILLCELWRFLMSYAKALKKGSSRPAYVEFKLVFSETPITKIRQSIQQKCYVITRPYSNFKISWFMFR